MGIKSIKYSSPLLNNAISRKPDQNSMKNRKLRCTTENGKRLKAAILGGVATRINLLVVCYSF